MAEGAPSIPTFKLVLVGDGGTGKVGSLTLLDALLGQTTPLPIVAAHPRDQSIN